LLRRSRAGLEGEDGAKADKGNGFEHVSFPKMVDALIESAPVHAAAISPHRDYG
jgi:hypothetical protein